MNLRDDLRLLWDVSPGGKHEGKGAYQDAQAIDQLLLHIVEYHRYALPNQVELHSQREKSGRV